MATSATPSGNGSTSITVHEQAKTASAKSTSVLPNSCKFFITAPYELHPTDAITRGIGETKCGADHPRLKPKILGLMPLHHQLGAVSDGLLLSLRHRPEV
jgi:hypothetical protein